MFLTPDEVFDQTVPSHTPNLKVYLPNDPDRPRPASFPAPSTSLVTSSQSMPRLRCALEQTLLDDEQGCNRLASFDQCWIGNVNVGLIEISSILRCGRITLEATPAIDSSSTAASRMGVRSFGEHGPPEQEFIQEIDSALPSSETPMRTASPNGFFRIEKCEGVAVVRPVRSTLGVWAVRAPVRLRSTPTA